MAVPKKKTSKSKRNQRRSHLALGKNAYREDKKTGELHFSHNLDFKTGMYKGKKILNFPEPKQE